MVFGGPGPAWQQRPSILCPAPSSPVVHYNENPTRALNTTPLKCFLPSTDAINRLMKVQGFLVQARFFEIHQVFAKQMSDTFFF